MPSNWHNSLGNFVRHTVVISFLALLSLYQGFAAEQTSVDLQLVLAIDASNSVTDERFDLQKRGYAQAFRNPQVMKAIASGSEQAIAVTMVQWTGPFSNEQVVPWTRVDSGSANALADAIMHTERQLYGGSGTSISGAIDYG